MPASLAGKQGREGPEANRLPDREKMLNFAQKSEKYRKNRENKSRPSEKFTKCLNLQGDWKASAIDMICEF
jgi:hypothetical protein